VPHDPALVDRAYREERASEEQRQQLEHASPEQLKRVLRDPAEPYKARSTAFCLLANHRDGELPEILFELFDDPEPEVRRIAIRYCALTDVRVMEKLRRLL